MHPPRPHSKTVEFSSWGGALETAFLTRSSEDSRSILGEMPLQKFPLPHLLFLVAKGMTSSGTFGGGSEPTFPGGQTTPWGTGESRDWARAPDAALSCASVSCR